MTAAAIREAHARHQKTLQSAYPQTLTLAGSTYAVAAQERTGMIEDAKGGFRQGRTAAITISASSLKQATLFDATTGILKRQTLTLNGTSYRIKRATLDSHAVLWTIEAVEAIA